MMGQKSKQKVWLMFAKLVGMADIEEKTRLDEILASNSLEKELFDSFSDAKDYQRRKEFMERIDVEKELGRIVQPMKRRSMHSVLFKWVAVFMLPLITGGVSIYYLREKESGVMAAISHEPVIQPGAVLVLSDGSSSDLLSTSGDIEERDGSKIRKDSSRLSYESGQESTMREDLIYNKLIISRGFEYALILSDGTKVWINSESELQYPVSFGKDVRHVKLSGEAYFEVSKDSKRPFIVEVDRGFEIKVLGTHFNVKAYLTDEKFQTTLMEGKVEVRPSMNEGIVLKPSEQMVIKRDGNWEVRKVNTACYIAWHEGWFYFDNEPLEQVLAMFTRWYDVEFDFKEIGLKEIMVTGKLKRFENLNVILDMLETIVGVRFEVAGKNVKVYKT